MLVSPQHLKQVRDNPLKKLIKNKDKNKNLNTLFAFN
jgi:hypothetical protein